MITTAPTKEAVVLVEMELWHVIGALKMIKLVATELAAATEGDVSSMAEGIVGSAASLCSHVRAQQIALGGDE